MKFLSKAITIIAEILLIIVGIGFYAAGDRLTAYSLIIPSGAALLLSIIAKFIKEEKPRPRVQLQAVRNSYLRKPVGHSDKNPKMEVYPAGFDFIMHWELVWWYELIVKNNSTQPAYSIKVEYLNTPPNTKIKGEFKKIDSLLPDASRTFSVEVNNMFEGTHIEADSKLDTDIIKLMEKAKIVIHYENEFGKKYSTQYDWNKDENTTVK